MRSFISFTTKASTALFCAAVLWELIARVGIASIVWLRYDPSLGHVHGAGSTVVTNEGFARSTYDKDGYRGGLPAVRPKMMVLTLGDSLTEAAQVPDSETFCHQATELLKAKGVDAFVANAGLAGGDPARYVAVAPWYLTHLHPERVVVQLDEGDFVADLPNHTGDFLIDKVGGNFKLVSAPHRVGIFERLESSKLPSPVKEAIGQYAPTSLLQLALNAATGTPQEAAMPELTPSGATKKDYFPYIRWSVGALKEAYAQPILLFIPDIDYFDPNSRESVEESELREECRLKGVILINMRKPFVDTFARTGQCASGFSNTRPGEGHMNGLGHMLVAQALALALLGGAK